MVSRLSPITAETVGLIHPRAARCLFWEVEPETRLRIEAHGSETEAFEKKAWLLTRLIDYGSCGFTLSFEETDNFRRPARATLLFCSPDDAPGVAPLPTAPVSTDAQLITSLFIDPRLTGMGLESVLLDAAVMDLTERGYAAIEAFGLRSEVEFAETTDEVIDVVVKREKIGLIDVEQLEGAGFKTVRDHPVLPRLRLELPPAHSLLSAADIELLLREAELLAPVS